MASLTVAGKANQAAIYPAFLVASYANESDPNARISLHVVDVDKLPDDDGAMAKLKLASSNNSIYGSEQIVKSITKTYNLFTGSGSQAAVRML